MITIRLIVKQYYSLEKPWTGFEYSRGVILFWELLPPPTR
jgi:hypothetical protein